MREREREEIMINVRQMNEHETQIIREILL